MYVLSLNNRSRKMVVIVESSLVFSFKVSKSCFYFKQKVVNVHYGLVVFCILISTSNKCYNNKNKVLDVLHNDAFSRG